jgi:heat shock protein HslJ
MPTSRRSLARLSFALLAALAIPTLSACSTGGSSDAPQGMTALAGEWNVLSINGSPLPRSVAESPRRPTLNFAPDGKVSGSGSVNRIMSAVNLGELDKGRITFKPVAGTLMAGPPEAMETERKFTAALANAKAFSVSGNDLSITDGVRELLTLSRARR